MLLDFKSPVFQKKTYACIIIFAIFEGNQLGMEKLALSKILNIEHPIIIAPMFLVSNEDMILAGTENGVAGAIPALNYRSVELLRTIESLCGRRY